MSDGQWNKIADGYARPGYRIRFADHDWHAGQPWCLEVVREARVQQGCLLVDVSFHSSLAAAKSRARRHEQRRNRIARIGTHLVLGGGALVALFVTAAVTDTVPFVVTAVLLYVGLASFGDAIWIWMNQTWAPGSAIGGPDPMSWSDRMIVATIRRARERASAPDGQPEPVPAIRLTTNHPGSGGVG